MPTLETSNMLIRLHHNILTSVNAIQGDTGRMWHFIIDDYEIPLDAEVRMYVKKPSGKEIYNSGIVKEQVLSFQPTMQTLAEIGQSIGQIQIISNRQSVSTFPFFLNVEKNYILSSEITSKDEFLILDGLIDEARNVISETRKLINTVTTQESSRVSAESARVEAEKLRQQNTSTAINNANDATSKAIAATTNTNNAANNANTKANLANTAATNANSKATLANDAATKANTAAKRAEEVVANINIIAITNSQIDSLKSL